MNYHWDWAFFLREADDGQMYWQWILHSLGWTCAVSLGALLMAFLLGSVIGIARTTRLHWLVRLGDWYVDIYRNVPLIVQLFLWFFVFPELLPKAASLYVKQEMPAAVIAIIGLGLFTSARIAEQVKSGLQTLPTGQRYAGLALGLTEWQVYRYVRLPMAYRIIIPTLTSESMNVFKNSSVTYAVGVLELYFQYKQIIEKTSQVMEITLVIGGLYMLMTFIINRLMAMVEKRLRVPGYISGGGH